MNTITKLAATATATATLGLMAVPVAAYAATPAASMAAGTVGGYSPVAGYHLRNHSQVALAGTSVATSPVLDDNGHVHGNEANQVTLDPATHESFTGTWAMYGTSSDDYAYLEGTTRALVTGSGVAGDPWVMTLLAGSTSTGTTHMYVTADVTTDAIIAPAGWATYGEMDTVEMITVMGTAKNPHFLDWQLSTSAYHGEYSVEGVTVAGAGTATDPDVLYVLVAQDVVDSIDDHSSSQAVAQGFFGPATGAPATTYRAAVLYTGTQLTETKAEVDCPSTFPVMTSSKVMEGDSARQITLWGPHHTGNGTATYPTGARYGIDDWVVYDHTYAGFVTATCTA